MASSKCLDGCIQKKQKKKGQLLTVPLHPERNINIPMKENYEENYDIESELLKLGYSLEYITRALKVYHNNYGNVYDIKVLSELIYRLKIKDEIKKQKQICNIFYSKINLLTKLESLGFPLYVIKLVVNEYQQTNGDKPYEFDIIAKQILQFRAKKKFNKNKPNRNRNKDTKQQNINKNTNKVFVNTDKKKLNKSKNIFSRRDRNRISVATVTDSDDTIRIHSSVGTFNDTVRIHFSDSDTCSSEYTNIIQTAINNFPCFQYDKNNEITIAICKCKYYKNISKCHSFIRINYILYCYQLWIASNYDNDSGDSSD
eukprot:465035_1